MSFRLVLRLQTGYSVNFFLNSVQKPRFIYCNAKINIALQRGEYMNLDFNPKENITNLDKAMASSITINDKINGLLVIKSIVKNWPDVLSFRLGLKEANFTMELRNGLKVKIRKPEDYFGFWNTKDGQMALLKQNGLAPKIETNIDKYKRLIKFNFMHKPIFLVYNSNRQLVNTIALIREQFIEEQYEWLDVRGKEVVDIGANIGDTALLFALKRAKHVYAFEPYPYSYKLALKNIKLNKLQGKITLLNEGCTGKESSININAHYQNTGGTDLKKFDSGKKIKLTTLSDIIKRFNIRYPAILKIDCEGCEYGILLKAKDPDLRTFEQIQIEYHYGYLNLKNKLESAGFHVNKTTPKYTLNQEAENKEMLVGYIYAERI